MNRWTGLLMGMGTADTKVLEQGQPMQPESCQTVVRVRHAVLFSRPSAAYGAVQMSKEDK